MKHFIAKVGILALLSACLASAGWAQAQSSKPSPGSSSSSQTYGAGGQTANQVQSLQPLAPPNQL